MRTTRWALAAVLLALIAPSAALADTRGFGVGVPCIDPGADADFQFGDGAVRKAHDEQRDTWHREHHGIETVRFTVDEVLRARGVIP